MADVYRDDVKICTAREASGFLERALGLMFRRCLKDGEGLLLEFSSVLKSRSVHTFFMRFTIDLVFIDADMTVTDLKTIAPWKIYSPKGACRWVLEVNEGTIGEHDIAEGDALTFR